MNNYTKVFSLLVFAILGYVGISHHEIWLDEAHHFVLARDSKTLSDLYFNNRYEGHPMLWDFLLWCMCKLFPTVFAMQLLHLLIAIFNAAIILWYSPFKLYQKIVVCFSYFMFYEYTIISRNYALSLFLVLVSVVMITRVKKNYPLILILLALLANTHLFSLVISIFLFIYLLSTDENFKALFSQKRNYIFIFLYLVLLLFAASFAKVPPDHFLFNYNNDKLLSIKRIGKALSICWKGLFHLQPINEFNLWNKNWLIEFNKNIGIVASALAWLIPFLLFKENKKILLLFFCISLCICLFAYMSPLNVAVRHSGFIFLAFVISYWILTQQKNKTQNKKSEFIFSVIIAQLCISSLVMYIHDYNYSFSEGKNASAFVQAINKENNIPVICHNTATPVISAYLQNKVIEINSLNKSSFCHWNNNPFVLTENEIVQNLIRFIDSTNVKTMIYISLNKIEINRINLTKKLRITLKNSFSKSIVKPENYYVYLVEKI